MNPLASMMNNAPQSPIANLLQMLKTGNPNQIAARLMQSNPQFKQFVEANKGKTPEQVASEHGIDLSQIMGGFQVIYKTCPDCGAHLDPDEECDCDREARHGDDNKQQKETVKDHERLHSL